MTKVAVTCVTYRNPESDTFIRTYGIVSLIGQMLNQDFAGEIGISLVDDSPEPHPFAQAVARALPGKVSYAHVQSRQELRNLLEREAPDMAMLAPTDRDLRNASLLLVEDMAKRGMPFGEADLKLARGDFNLTKPEWDTALGWVAYEAVDAATVQEFLAAQNPDAVRDDPVAQFWKARLGEVRSYGALVPFEHDYPIQTNTYAQVFAHRPTIGMKKNAGNALAAARFGAPDVLVYADDDDQHAPDYVARSVDALGDHDFTRMTRYLTYIYNKNAAEARPGYFDLPVVKQMNGYWALPYNAQQNPMHIWLPKEGRFMDKTIGSKFSRPVTLAWPILSHEGALHTYSYKSWKDNVPHIGGAFPVSFCEDIIGYRKLKDFLGHKFTDALTPVAPGEEAFLRIADGNNASAIEVTQHISNDNMPAWAQQAVNFLHTAQNTPGHSTKATMENLASTFLRAGRLDIAALPDAPLPRSAGNDDRAIDPGSAQAFRGPSP